MTHSKNKRSPGKSSPARKRRSRRKAAKVHITKRYGFRLPFAPPRSEGDSTASGVFILTGLLALLLTAGCTPPPTEVQRVNLVEDWRDEVIYQLMTDRFANGDVNNDWNVDPGHLGRWQGGDWQGIVDNLDYLQELGVTAIWISPAVRNVEEDAGFSGYHGYWTQAFDQTNPHFGDMVKLREMVDAAHAAGIAVILDVVTNHVGQLFYYDINMNGRPDQSIWGDGGHDPTSPVQHVSEWDPDFDIRGVQSWTSLGESGLAPVEFVNYAADNRVPPSPAEFANPSWYNRRGRVFSWEIDEQVVLGDFPGGLKDLMTAKPEVEDALIRAFEFWIDNVDFDGFRIDTIKHVEHEFWQAWAPAMREHAASVGKDNFFMFGEAFDGRDDLIGSFTFDQEVDSAFYFSQKFQVFDAVFKSAGPTRGIEELWTERLTNYGDVPHEGGIGVPPQQALVNFMDNHDVARFLYDLPEVDRLHLALAFMLTMDGIPCIYYGTEQAFDGGNDPGNREVLWESGFDTTGATFTTTRDLIALRKAISPLRRGDLTVRWSTDHIADEADAGIFAFERNHDGQRALVVFNTSFETRSGTSWNGEDMPTGFEPGERLADVWRDVGGVHEVAEDGSLYVELPPSTAMILVPTDVADGLEL
jgi:alpha-amylase